MFVTLSESLSHFYVNDSASYLKVILSKDSPLKVVFTPVNYSGEESELKDFEWHKFTNGEPSQVIICKIKSIQ